MYGIMNSDLGKAAIALAGCWLAFKFIPNQHVKAAVLGVAGIVVAKQLPYVSDVI